MYILVTGQRERVPPLTSVVDNLEQSANDISSDDKNLWLFDLERDPLEVTDISSKYSDVVVKLLDRLAYYNSTAVPALNKPFDQKSNPDHHGGVWGPWEGESVKEYREFAEL